ncbi:MAG: histidinol-phosphate transaminase [Sphingomonadaceae bacterium]
MGVAGIPELPPVRRCVEEMEEYVPISTPEALAQKLGIPPEQIIKIDGNENPYGCSPRVQMALAECHSYHRYPDPWQLETRDMLAGHIGAPAESLMLGAGSDELIDTLMRVYLEPGDEVIDLPPTFGMYSFSTQVCGGRVVQVPRDEQFGINLPAVERAITDRTRMIFLASPNNPSGNVAPRWQVERLLATGRLVVVDEAYAEFATTTLVPLVAEHPNLVVLRTFSKWAGLAGLRVGYGVFPQGVLRQMWKVKQPYNLNVAAQVAVRESLLDIERLQSNVRRIVEERERFRLALSDLGFLRVHPSEANFLLCDVLEGSAEEVVRFLASRGIIVRYFRKPRLFNSVRFSVGLPEHTDAVVAALREWKASPIQ